MTGYGSQPPDRAEPGQYPVPPPPDGKVPMRLPIMGNLEQPNEPAAPGQGVDDDELMKLLQALGQR